MSDKEIALELFKLSTKEMIPAAEVVEAFKYFLNGIKSDSKEAALELTKVYAGFGGTKNEVLTDYLLFLEND